MILDLVPCQNCAEVYVLEETKLCDSCVDSFRTEEENGMMHDEGGSD